MSELVEEEGQRQTTPVGALSLCAQPDDPGLIYINSLQVNQPRCSCSYPSGFAKIMKFRARAEPEGIRSLHSSSDKLLEVLAASASAVRMLCKPQFKPEVLRALLREQYASAPQSGRCGGNANETEEIRAERSAPDRRRPNPSTMQILETLELSEAELMTSAAKFTLADEGPKAAQLREERLLEILTKGQQRIRHLLIGAVVAGLLIASLLAIIFFYLIKTHSH